MELLLIYRVLSLIVFTQIFIVPGALAEATPSVDAALMHAAQRGNTDLIESLVRQGASVNVVGEHGLL